MRRAACISFVVIPLCGCFGDEVDIDQFEVPSRVAGFFCDTTPSGAYSPGYIFWEDAQGIDSLAADLSGQGETMAYEAALGTYAASVSRGAGLNIQLVGVGTGDASVTSSRSARVSFSDGGFLYMTDAGIDTIQALAAERISPRPGREYFVVRDAVQAKGIDIQLNAETEAALGGEASINELLSGSPNLNLTREQDLSIINTFETPLNVCFRAVRMEPPEKVADAGGGDQNVSGGAGWLLTSVSATSAQMARVLER